MRPLRSLAVTALLLVPAALASPATARDDDVPPRPFATASHPRRTSHAPGAPASSRNARRLPPALRRGVVAYTSPRGELWLLDVATRARRRLTRPAHGADFDPRFSPDGRHIIFRSERGLQPEDPFHVGYNALFTVRLDGTRLRQVNPAGGGLFADWSPTTDLISFSGPGPDPRADHIFVMGADGANPRDLGVPGECSRWSPDGLRIAYCSHSGDGNWAVWTVRADGSGATQLTFPTFRPPAGANGDYPVAWSPDGTRLLISSARAEARDMYIVTADGTKPRRVLRWTRNGVNSPSVWLAGGWIVFSHSSRDEARPRWYAVRPDGTGLVRLPWLDGAGDPIAWSPQGRA